MNGTITIDKEEREIKIIGRVMWINILLLIVIIIFGFFSLTAAVPFFIVLGAGFILGYLLEQYTFNKIVRDLKESFAEER